MNYLSKAEMKKLFIEQGGNWVAEQQFWLFGTAKYYEGRKVTRKAAEQDAKHFFNILDRKLICRSDCEKGRRLQRLVFIETGRTRDNTHIHFYIKGRQSKDYRKIKMLSEEIWPTRIKRGLDLVMLDNIKSNYERKGYLFKEASNEQSTYVQKTDWKKLNKKTPEILASDVMTVDVMMLDCCYID